MFVTVSAVGLWELGATGVVPARVEVPPHSLFSGCLCLLCPQTITVMIIDAPGIGKPDIQFKQTTVEHLEKNFWIIV